MEFAQSTSYCSKGAFIFKYAIGFWISLIRPPLAALGIGNALYQRSLERHSEKSIRKTIRPTILGGVRFSDDSDVPPIDEPYIDEEDSDDNDEIELNDYDRMDEIYEGPLARAWLLGESGNGNEPTNSASVSSPFLAHIEVTSSTGIMSSPREPRVDTHENNNSVHQRYSDQDRSHNPQAGSSREAIMDDCDDHNSALYQYSDQDEPTGLQAESSFDNQNQPLLSNLEEDNLVSGVPISPAEFRWVHRQYVFQVLGTRHVSGYFFTTIVYLCSVSYLITSAEVQRMRFLIEKG